MSQDRTLRPAGRAARIDHGKGIVGPGRKRLKITRLSGDAPKWGKSGRKSVSRRNTEYHLRRCADRHGGLVQITAVSDEGLCTRVVENVFELPAAIEKIDRHDPGTEFGQGVINHDPLG